MTAHHAIWWIAGASLLAAGLALAGWALFEDTFRARRRPPGPRCPRCWYRVPPFAAACPECGHRPCSPKDLHRTRRHPRALLLALLITAAGIASTAKPTLTSQRWQRLVPDTILLSLLGRLDKPWIVSECTRRFCPSQAPVRWVDRARLSPQGWRRFDRGLNRLLDQPDPRATALAALNSLSPAVYDPRTLGPGLARAIASPDPILARNAVAALRTLRFELGPHRRSLADAIARARRRHPDLADLCDVADAALASSPDHAPTPSWPDDPDDLVYWINSAPTPELARFLGALGLRDLLTTWEPDPPRPVASLLYNESGPEPIRRGIVSSPSPQAALISLTLDPGPDALIVHSASTPATLHGYLLPEPARCTGVEYHILYDIPFLRVSIEAQHPRTTIARDLWLAPAQAQPALVVFAGLRSESPRGTSTAQSVLSLPLPFEQLFANLPTLPDLPDGFGWLEPLAWLWYTLIHEPEPDPGPRYSFTFSLSPPHVDAPLFSRIGECSFSLRRAGRTSTFVFDRDASTVSPDAPIAASAPGSPGFLALFEVELRSLARTVDAHQRRWLEDLLAASPHTPPARRIRRVLEDTPPP